MVANTQPKPEPAACAADIAEPQDLPEYSELPERPPLLVPLTAYRLLVMGTIITLGVTKALMHLPWSGVSTQEWLIASMLSVG